MNKLIGLAMISCKQAALLDAKKSLFSLSPVERFKLKLHKKVCVVCEGYAKQNEILERAIDSLLKQKQQVVLELSADQRAKILEAIKA